eukprot:gene22760-biopygen1960
MIAIYSSMIKYFQIKLQQNQGEKWCEGVKLDRNRMILDNNEQALCGCYHQVAYNSDTISPFDQLTAKKHQAVDSIWIG